MTALERLVGSWEFTMQHSAMPQPITGRQRYEWVLDGAFLLQHWTYDHPEFPNAMALLSQERCHYFDVRGIVRIFDLDVSDDGWSMIRLDDDFAQRSSATFVAPDRIEGSGDLSRDGGTTWIPDFTIIYRRSQ
jgi:hypothetical protein